MSVLRTGRTIIGSVIFLDIVAYTKSSDTRQLAMKTAFNEAVSQAVEGLPEPERIILDTGDGCAICLMGDPEDAIYVASSIHLEANNFSGPAAQSLRIGINLGPLKLISDLSGRTNVVGDGINVAQRIMSFAGENEILVSRSYYEVVACLSDDNKRLFQQLGILKDKHIREHQVYALNIGGAVPEPSPQNSSQPEGPESLSEIDKSRLQTASAQLASVIGPLATVLAERAIKSSRTFEGALEQMATAIVDECDRKAFLQSNAGKPSTARSTEALEPSPSVVGQVAALTPEERRSIEHHFLNHMGPIARVLIDKAITECATFDVLCQKLASHIENDDARQRFLAAVHNDGVES